MSARALFIAAVIAALFGFLIVSHSELWRWAYIPALAALFLYFAAVRQYDKEEP